MSRQARVLGRKIDVCGQAPSDYPDFADFLVECGINGMSLNPDAILRTMQPLHERDTQRSAAAYAPA